MAFKILGVGKTDIGSKRSTNQDRILVNNELKLYAVADGMGGHNAGEIASSVALEVLELAILKLSERKNLNPVPFLKEAVSLASIRVYEKALMDEKLEGMGTTLVAIYATDSKIYIIQVGDSRVYLVRDTGMWQVTEDHSLVNEQLRTGLITKEQAEKSNYKNVITRSVGFEEIVEPEIYSREIQKGDLFLLCSDGLTSMLTNDEIYNNIDPGNLEKSIDKLISSSNKAGGLDNVSVVFVKVN